MRSVNCKKIEAEVFEALQENVKLYPTFSQANVEAVNQNARQIANWVFAILRFVPLFEKAKRDLVEL